MVIESLATATIAFLAPYLSKAGESFAEKAGEKLFTITDNLFKAIKKKFSDDPYAEQTLNRVESKPNAEGSQAIFRDLLVEKMQADEEFRALIEKMVSEAKSADKNNIIATGERSVAFGGSNYGNINTGDTTNNPQVKP